MENGLVPIKIKDTDREGFIGCPLCGETPKLHEYTSHFHMFGKLNLSCANCKLIIFRIYDIDKTDKPVGRKKALNDLRKNWNQRFTTKEPATKKPAAELIQDEKKYGAVHIFVFTDKQSGMYRLGYSRTRTKPHDMLAVFLSYAREQSTARHGTKNKRMRQYAVDNALRLSPENFEAERLCTVMGKEAAVAAMRKYIAEHGEEKSLTTDPKIR